MPTTDLPAKLLQELSDGLLIAYRVKNHKLDYSLMNRPEPTLSGVDDHALATAIIIAGREFDLVVDENIMQSERVVRSDGREVTYNEAIDINWEDRVIRSSRRKEMTMDVLAGIVTALMQQAAAPTPDALAPESKSN